MHVQYLIPVVSVIGQGVIVSSWGSPVPRATAEILGLGGKHAEIPVFNAIPDHLRKSVLIGRYNL